jgi:dihydrolipoamide dehydrogenase
MTHVVVIGAYGSAGVAVAEELAEAPEADRVTLVDDGDPGGGLCILRGCMPSKEVLSAANHRYRARHDDRLVGEPPEMDLERIVERKDEHVLSFAAHRREAVHTLAAENEGVEFVHDAARFVDDRTVRISEREIEADYAVIATGSAVNVPDLPGMDEVDYWTSADVLDATDLPESGVMMGFGYVGIEMAPYLAEAGVDLTVIEHDDRPLDRAHPEIGDALLDLYREDFGIEVVSGARERRVEVEDGRVSVEVEYENEDGEWTGDGETDRLAGEELFLFTGREPALDGLGIENTALDPGSGWVEDTMRAVDDDRVFVVGDAIGERMILHEAKEEGYLAGRNIRADLHGESLERYDPLTHLVMFSGAAAYPYVSLGLTADEAREADRDPVAVQRDAADDGVFKTKDAAAGLARLIVARDGEILGYHGIHFQADVMAKTMQVILENEMHLGEVPDRAYHPTTPEIIDGLLQDAAAAIDEDAETATEPDPDPDWR